MKKAIIIIVVLAVVAVGGFGIYKAVSKTDTPVVSTDTNTESQTTTESTEPVAGEDAVITYSADGFSPATLTVKTGTVVTIKNTSGHSMQFESDPHPAHTENEELNADTVANGKSQTFTVTQTGTFGYHNHLNASETGTIVVQ